MLGRTSDCEECWRKIDVADDSVEGKSLRDAWSTHEKWHSRIELICDVCHRVSGDPETAADRLLCAMRAGALTQQPDDEDWNVCAACVHCTYRNASFLQPAGNFPGDIRGPTYQNIRKIKNIIKNIRGLTSSGVAEVRPTSKRRMCGSISRLHRVR